jgi:hypothetical protein
MGMISSSSDDPGFIPKEFEQLRIETNDLSTVKTNPPAYGRKREGWPEGGS